MSYYRPIEREQALAKPVSDVNAAHRAGAWIAMAALNAALWTFGAVAVIYA